MNKLFFVPFVALLMVVALTFNVGAMTIPEATTRYMLHNTSNLYSGFQLKITQYLQTAPEHTTAWSGETVSKEFSPWDGSVVYRESNGNYEFHIQPFLDDWWYDGSISQAFNNGGFFQYSIQLPFEDSNGQLFDLEKLNDTSYVDKIALYFNSVIYSNGSTMNLRAFASWITLKDGTIVYLKRDSTNTVSPADIAIVADVNFKASEIKYFGFDFRYYGLPAFNAEFEFTVTKFSYIDVVDYSLYEDSVISGNDTTLGDIGGSLGDAGDKLDVEKPSSSVVGNVSSNLGLGGIDSFNQLGDVFSALEDTPIGFLITNVLLTGCSIAFIGYALHGKR